MFFSKKSEPQKKDSIKEEEAEFIIVRTEIEGSIIAENANIIIKKNSIIKGDISGKIVDIAGHVTGNTKAEIKLTLRGSAVVYGDILSPLFEVEEGAAGQFSVTMKEDDKTSENVEDKKNFRRERNKEKSAQGETKNNSDNFNVEDLRNKIVSEMESTVKPHQKNFWN